MSPEDLDHADAAARMHASCGHPDDGVGPAYLYVRERIAALEARLASAEAVVAACETMRMPSEAVWPPTPIDRVCAALRRHREAYPEPLTPPG